ncbi:MAG: ABC transporter substrate-binding protein [Lentisphaerae bacterium]|nr:ABC transporter substrate-binding protein [Lentisphaerota bacterium]
MVWSRHIALLLLIVLLLPGCSSRHSNPAPDGDRVVSLAPNLTEIICAIGAGAALVGRTSACDYPPEIVKAVPIIGGFGAPSLDRLLKSKPTLILDIALEDETTAKLIAQLGIRRARVPCSTLADIPTAIITVGRLAHAEPAATSLAERIRREVIRRRAELELRKAAGQSAPTVFAEIWGDPLMTVGRNSFVAELITLAGGRNLGDEVALAELGQADKDYFPVASEWVIARDPDIILCLYPIAGGSAQNPEEAHVKRLAARTGWSQIKAVRTLRVYGAFDNNLILRPGPRVLEGIEALQTCIQQSENQNYTPGNN